MVLHCFIEAKSKWAESWHQFWPPLERDVHTQLKIFLLLDSLHMLCPYLCHGKLTSATRASVTTWPEVRQFCLCRAALKLAACSEWISPSALLLSKEPSDLVCPDCFQWADWWYFGLKVILLSFKTPTGKTLYNTENSVLTWNHPCSRNSTAVCWSGGSLCFIMADFLTVEFTTLQHPFHLIFLPIFY